MKFLMFILITTSTSWATDSELKGTSWFLNQGEVTYHVKFVLKNVEGVSKNIKGKGLCNQESCHFLVATPLKDFISGDTNRDLHMIEVTKGAIHPMVVVNIDFPIGSKSDVIATFKIDFAGHSKVYNNVILHPEKTLKKIRTSGKFKFLLSDFNVDRPALLGVKIEDEVELKYKLHFNKLN